MMSCVRGVGVWGMLAAVVLASAAGQEVSREKVLRSIDLGRRFLLKEQRSDGSWRLESRDLRIGATSLALMALINSGMTADDEPVARGLKFLRTSDDPGTAAATYETSLMIMALAAAKDRVRDRGRLITLTQKLEDWQIKNGPEAGSWSYGGTSAGSGDNSNAQYAVLGLREAAYAGVAVSPQTWELAYQHWKNAQGPDGAFGYSGRGGGGASGSMTAAGISSLVITHSMLRPPREELPDGTPICCQEDEADEALERAAAWLGRNFSVKHNPQGGIWYLYYIYGLERAGRLSGRRFFGPHDWYRRGAEYLVAGQSPRGSWKGEGPFETDPVLATSFVLLFLSKGLAPVLINKLHYGEGDAWNSHPDDVRNLTEHITTLEKWPPLLTWQQLDIQLAAQSGSVQDLLQAPVLFLNGDEVPTFNDAELVLLREYVNQGGFVLASAACTRTEFDAGFRALIPRLFPEGDYKLKRLPPDHAVFRAEYPLDPETTELWGVDIGCRTSVMYAPQDLGCLWNKWTPAELPTRSAALKAQVVKANRVGVNIIAYATGREPWDKLNAPVARADGPMDRVERGLLQVAKLRHSGGWDVAPHALHNLLVALNATAGTAAVPQGRPLAANDPNLFKYPLVYMHGRNKFQLGPAELDQLRDYLQNGGVLFADACCGAPQFDKSFRDLAATLFPKEKLAQIPATHEMFTSAVDGHELKKLKRREPRVDLPGEPLESAVVEKEPFLEGVELDGRYVIIYSKYDISCALERQANFECPGYLPADALKLAVNIVLYALEP